VSLPNHPSEAAYQRLLPEIEAFPEAELVPITVDVWTAVTTVLGALPEIRALRPEIEAEWRRFDFERFDKLEAYALALSYVHAGWRGALVPKTEVAGMASELAEARDQLLLDARALAGRRLIEGERLKEIRAVPGYRPLAGDVLTLVGVLKENWRKIEGKTAMTLLELNDLGAKASDLLAAVGIREQGPTSAGEMALHRQKAFGLFVRAYEDARRAVLYLRARHGDGNEIAPSIYSGRARRSSDGSVESEALLTPEPGSAAAGSSPPGGFNLQNPTGLPLTNPLVNS
jgi:hypothetical protein